MYEHTNITVTMDAESSHRALVRLIVSSSHHQHDNCGNGHSYLQRATFDPHHPDRLEQLNEYGDTALHFLLSSHQTSVETLESFFPQSPTTTALTQTNKDGVSPLHMAVFRNSFHAAAIVSWLLDHGDSALLAQQAVYSALPLHLLVRHAVTLDRTVWDRVLRAYPAAAAIPMLENGRQILPLEMLHQNVQRFRWASELMANVSTHNDDAPVVSMNMHTEQGVEDNWAYMTIVTPWQFVKCSLQLIAAMYSRSQQHKNGATTMHKTESTVPSIHTVVATPACPVLLVRLLCLQHSGNGDTRTHLLSQRNAHGQLPLHTCCPANTPLIDYLLRHSSTSAASTVSDHGQWPLHTCPTVAVARAAPLALWVRDPRTHLYPYQLAAVSSSTSSSPPIQVAYELLRMEPGVLQRSVGPASDDDDDQAPFQYYR